MSNFQWNQKSQGASTMQMNLLTNSQNVTMTASSLATLKLRASLQDHMNANTSKSKATAGFNGALTSTAPCYQNNGGKHSPSSLGLTPSQRKPTSKKMPTKTRSLALPDEELEQEKTIKKSSSCNGLPMESQSDHSNGCTRSSSSPEDKEQRDSTQMSRTSSAPSLDTEQKAKRKARRRRTSRTRLTDGSGRSSSPSSPYNSLEGPPVPAKGVLKKVSSYTSTRFMSEPKPRRSLQKNVSFVDMHRNRWDSEASMKDLLNVRRTKSTNVSLSLPSKEPKTGKSNFSWGSNGPSSTGSSTQPKASSGISPSTMALLMKQVGAAPKQPSKAPKTNMFSATIQDLVQQQTSGQNVPIIPTVTAAASIITEKSAATSWNTMPTKPQRQSSVELDRQEQEKVCRKHGDLLEDDEEDEPEQVQEAPVVEITNQEAPEKRLSWNTIPSLPKRQTSIESWSTHHGESDDEDDADLSGPDDEVLNQDASNNSWNSMPSKPKRRASLEFDLQDDQHDSANSGEDKQTSVPQEHVILFNDERMAPDAPSTPSTTLLKEASDKSLNVAPSKPRRRGSLEFEIQPDSPQEHGILFDDERMAPEAPSTPSTTLLNEASDKSLNVAPSKPCRRGSMEFEIQPESSISMPTIE